MKIRFVAAFLCVVHLSLEAFADDGIKRSAYPFMAFIYYQDETILDLRGARFLQGAVLIRPSYLISSSPESTISSDPLRKTLLARLGATVIDAKFSLNEDEDEQEQEIIQITRPYQHNSSQWWVTDISLLKTLQPFESTKAVHITQLFKKEEPEDKICHILVFQKKGATEVRALNRLEVELLPASAENCGEKFVQNTMTCATEASSEEQLTSDYCHGNSGGPLVCDDNVMALQTYINGNCNPPHLYQLLAPRKRFLDCGMDEKCNSTECQDVCSVTLKDAPITAIPISPELNTKTALLTETTQTTKTDEPTDATLLSTEPTVPTTATPSLDAPSTSWPNEREGHKAADEDSDVLARPVKMDAQEETHKPIERSSANTNMVVFLSFVYSGFLLCICLM